MTITRKLTTIVAGFAMVAALAFSFALPAQAALTESQIQSILSLLSSFGADQTTINNVNASLRGQPTSGGGSTTPTTSCSAFTRDLTIGSTGADVMQLQKILNANGFTVSASGAGSPGNESTYFGSLTQVALGKWQASVGISPAAGYFGPITRAKLAASCTSTPGGPTTPAPTGTGLSVSAATQPQNAIAPQSANRVPFTRFTVTAGTDGAVVMSGVVVQRVGLGSNAPFAGVTLIDQDGNQLGTAKVFNSNDQATIGESVTIPAGQSRTFLVAANMGSSLANYAGQVPAISVIGVNTSATVSGSLPITGAYHTINATLSVGTMELDTSNAFAANSSVSKELGSTAQRVSGFRLTAGSVEDVRLKMIRFNQTGSASTVNDLANIMVVVDGTSYPATVSADGKYITANLGTGILVPEGNSVEAYVQYDIVGANSNGRTVIFDIDKNTDIYGEGVTYGYGVSPSTTGASSVPGSRTNTAETSGTPYLYANQITITGASVTTIQKANSVPAQNIAVNLSNQPLGGFQTDIKGEAITVQQLVIDVATSSGATRLTNVTIVNENGTVVAGPVDLPATASNNGSLTFTDAITFPVGLHTYTIRGKVGTDATNGATYVLSTDPSTDWTNVKGDVTGNTITLSQGSFNMNTMTIRTAALAITRATSPASQTVVAGGTAVLMTNFQLDATQSGEDVRLSSFPLLIDNTSPTGGTGFEGDPDLLTSCQLFDGSTALNTGSNVVNPTDTGTTSDTTATATFDNPVTIAKGSVKTLGLRCNISSATPNSSQFVWEPGTGFSSTGAVSGSSITETFPSDTEIIVTVGTGSATVSTDASSPSYMLAAAGSTEVTIGAFRFRASNEAVNLQKLGLSLSNTASSAPGDLIKVSVYDGATKVGEAFFTGSGATATSTFTQVVTLPKDQDKTLTIKADLAQVGTSQAVTFSGHLLAVNFLNAEGVGAQSGITQNSFSGSTSVSGVRVLKSFPAVSLVSLPSTGIADGRLMRFSVTADSAGPIGLTEFNFTFATTSVTLSNVNVYGYTDSNFSSPISGVQTGGMFSSTNGVGVNWVSSSSNFEFTAYNGTASTTVQVPAGGTRYFEVRGSVAGVQTGSSITTTLKNGTAFVTCAASAATTNPLCAADAAGLGADFIWSPNSTTTAARADADWTGGYGVSGLPSNGLIQTRSN